MFSSHLRVFLISVKPLTTENTENKTTPKIVKLQWGRFANRNSETSTETGRGRVRGAKQNGAFSGKSIRTFGWSALEPNKIFGSVQAGRFGLPMWHVLLAVLDCRTPHPLLLILSLLQLCRHFSRSLSSTASISSSPVCSPAPNPRPRNHRSLPRTVS